MSGLSTEAKLFAQLAEKARTAFNDTPPVGQSVSRALQLVGELEKELSDTQVESTPSVIDVAAKPAQFFKQDEAIFEPAPKQAPIALAIAPESPPEASTRGAKLVVHRIVAPASLDQRTAAEPTRQLDFAAPDIASAPAVVESPSKARIIVIRRKADEMENVPLLDHSDHSDQSDNLQHTPSDAA